MNYAKVCGGNVDIEPAEPGGCGLTVPVASLCHFAGIGYTNQGARIVNNAVDIDPPREGACGVSISVESIRRFYRPF